MADTTPAPAPKLRDAFAALLASLGILGPGGVSTRGWKTYLAAAAMAGYGVLLVRTGDVTGGIQAILTAAAMAGLRSALPVPGPTPTPAPGPPPAPGPAIPSNRPVLKTLAALLVGFGSFVGLQRVVPTPAPGPGPIPFVPPSPAPRPSDPFAGKLFDAYASDGGPTAVNAAAKEQLVAVYRAAATAARDSKISTGADLAAKVSETAKTLLGRHYLTGLPQTRAAINSTVSDQLEPDTLTDASRAAAADLFTRIANVLGGF